jgi:hypothetical protein
MNSDILSKVCKSVYARFPEVKGSHPSQSAQPGGRTLLIFEGNAATPDGHTIRRTVRVVVSEKGQVEKMTTSR